MSVSELMPVDVSQPPQTSTDVVHDDDADEEEEEEEPVVRQRPVCATSSSQASQSPRPAKPAPKPNVKVSSGMAIVKQRKRVRDVSQPKTVVSPVTPQ